MKKIKLSLLAVALMVATVASAQVSFGVQGGINLSNLLVSGGSENEPKIGFNAGILTDFNFTPEMGIRSGLFFTTKGFRISHTEDGVRGRATTNLMYLQIPVHFAYWIDVSPGTRVVLHAGPYVAYGVRGRMSINVDSDDFGFGITPNENLFGSGDDKLNPFDFGVGLGVGFEFGRIITGIGVDMGLLSVFPGDTARNMNASLTLGYRF